MKRRLQERPWHNSARKPVTKTALVVGGSGAIGSAAVSTLVQDGFKVWATYFQDKTQADQAAANISFVPMDCTQETSVKTGMEKILSAAKALDVIVFSVTPPLKYSAFLNASWESYQLHFNTQVKGLFLIAKNLRAQIQSNHKTKMIIILTEFCVSKPAAGVSDYATSKYALLGLSKVLAVELSKYQTTVNMISPGMTETDLLSHLPPKAIELAAMNNPLKRIALPQDVANAVSFLASEKSDYLNGTNILVNGGGVML